MKKDCAFQYAYNKIGMFGYTGDVEIKEDTELITLEEAKELWQKYLPEFVSRLKAGHNPEMAIWINMEKDTDYKETLVHADENTAIDSNGELYNTKREYLCNNL